ncbi:uncharacterized protein LOC132201536 [Neocloeon triangulifer]|uniref:uncharacterized protein LOC132201536 n=1 Tax=Neocloeon triangulifer TaxID=2078957 RepID=UPI00286FA02F|nr:uncharacterized protein LOC132201536 [Neocloeon triangulifer]
MHRHVIVLLSAFAALEARSVPALRSSDRTLYIRSIPEVKGYNSQIYEVLMTPLFSSRKDDSSPAVAPLGKKALAVLRSPKDEVHGEVVVKEEAAGKMQLRAELHGLPSGLNLGLSVHENGDCRKLGPVFKPDQPANAIPSPEIPAGYLGSFQTDDSGKLEIELTLGPKLALSGHRSLLARGISFHDMSKKDSSVVACGVLGRAAPSPEEMIAARKRRHHFGHK